MDKYIKYAHALNATAEVIAWITHTLANHLQKTEEDQTEIEHIIDYLLSDSAPKTNLTAMSYADALRNTKKWTKILIKKGENIQETESDTEVAIDFGDGFKIVKLLGKNAYEREGYLMRHCVAGYYGTDKEIYSLRDAHNMPHCTMERNQQVKGKGNGDIHPKYVGYVVQFLQYIGMTVGDTEMAHLGYVNIESIYDDIDHGIDQLLYDNKYLPKNKKNEIKDKTGKPKNDIDMLSIFPLIEETDEGIRVAYDIPSLVSSSIELIRQRTTQTQSDDNNSLVSGNYSQLAGGNNSRIAGGYNSQLAGGNNSQLAGGCKSQLAGGDYSQLAGGNNSQLAGGCKSRIAGGNNSRIAGGDNSQLAGGYNSRIAGGDNSRIAGGDDSSLEIGHRGIALGDNKSRVKGKMGAGIVLVARDGNQNITVIKAGIIDGEILKEDVWYELRDGEFCEVNERG